MSKKIYVFDTSVLLSDAQCFTNFGNNEIVLPLKVLEEVDGHKKRQDSVGANARQVIRFLDQLREKGSLSKGVRVDKNKSTLRVEVRRAKSDVLDNSVPDNEIIETALNLRTEERKVVVVSRDINMRVKCDALGLESEDYAREHVVNSTGEVWSGCTNLTVDDMDVDSIHNGEFFELSEKDSEGLVANQFLKVVSALDEKKSAIVRYNKGNRSVSKLKDIKDAVYGKIKPRNKEQNMALNLLLDHNISVVTLIGKAGCGKTVAALAAALQMQEKEPERYRKIIVLKPIVAVGGKDVGYLPGSLQEKLSPWLAPIYDNLEFLLSSKKSQNNQETLKRTIDWYFENGIIEVEAMTYIRGRSLANCIIILDEAQNTNAHEIKTILTRVGEGTKIILTGDIEQVDSPYLDSTNNGLVYLIEKFKGVDFYGHVTFLKGERSKVATVAAERL
jgi:PhoH-like ATPase